MKKIGSNIGIFRAFY